MSSPRCRFFLLIFAMGCGDEGDDRPCTAAALSEALQAASAGDVVEVGACRIEGEFEVPGGVTLEGAGPAETFLVGGEGPVLTLSGDGTTVVRDLAVESDGRMGIRSSGSGEIELDGVDVRATRGIGIGIDGNPVVSLHTVHLTGPVLPENVEDFGSDVDPAVSATHGLVLLEVEDASLEDVTATGFASYGALLVGTNAAWNGGALDGNLGIGLCVAGGTASVDGVSIAGTLHGSGLRPGYSALVMDGAEVDSTGLSIRDSTGYGMVVSEATGHHEGLVAEGNTDAAVWAQSSTSFELTGATLSGNGFAGVVAADSSGIVITDSEIADTVLATSLFLDAGTIEVGDGVQLVGSAEGIRLEALTLRNNGRVGVLLDLDGASTAGVSLDDVDVEGNGESLGVIAQNGTIEDGWDASVARSGAVLDNDEAFTTAGSELPLAGILGAASFPQIDRNDLRGLIGPND